MLILRITKYVHTYVHPKAYGSSTFQNSTKLETTRISIDSIDI